MKAAIAILLVWGAGEGIYRAMLHHHEIRVNGTGALFLALLICTALVSLLTGLARVFRKINPDVPITLPPTKSLGNIVLQTMLEESIRFGVFASVFAILAEITYRLGYDSIEFHVHSSIDRLGWPGMWAACAANTAFTALHAYKSRGNTVRSSFLTGAIFTIALLNYGIVAATALHLVYSLGGMLWTTIDHRRHSQRLKTT